MKSNKQKIKKDAITYLEIRHQTWLGWGKRVEKKVKGLYYDAHNNTAITGNSIGLYTNNTVKPDD